MRKSKTETTCNIVNTIYKKSGPVTKRKRTIKKTFRTNKGTKSFFHTFDINENVTPAKLIKQAEQIEKQIPTISIAKEYKPKKVKHKKITKTHNTERKMVSAAFNLSAAINKLQNSANSKTPAKRIKKVAEQIERQFEQKKLSDHRVGHKKYKVEHKKINSQYIPKFDLSDIDQEIIDFIDDN